MEQKKIIPFIVAFAQIGHTFSANALLCSLESFVQVILDYHYLAKLKWILEQIFSDFSCLNFILFHDQGIHQLVNWIEAIYVEMTLLQK